MKNPVVLGLFALLLFSASRPANQEILLFDAIKTKKLTATFAGQDKSTHYLKPIVGILKNVSSANLSVKIPVGYRFASTDTTVQDFVVTQEELIALVPGQSIEINVAAMCVQSHNAAPGGADGFSLVGFASQELQKMAETIAAQNMQDIRGQAAMWAVSDGYPLNGILRDNTPEEREVMRVAATLSKQSPFTDIQCAQVLEGGLPITFKAQLNGTFSFNFSRAVPIHIALFKENGIVLQEIYHATAAPGKHTVTYTFDAYPHIGETIYAKLIAFDDVLLTRKIDL